MLFYKYNFFLLCYLICIIVYLFNIILFYLYFLKSNYIIKFKEEKKRVEIIRLNIKDDNFTIITTSTES